MAQSYFSASASAPAVSSPMNAEFQTTKETASSPVEKVVAAKPEDVQATYVDQRDRIIGALDSTTSILKEFRVFNKDSWIMRYPNIKPSSSPPAANKRRPSARHSMSFADDPLKEIEVDVAHGRRAGMKRSLTLATVPDDISENAESDTEQDASEGEVGLIPADFQVLRLDLKLGPHGSSSSAGGLVSQLEKSSIANLIDDRIGHSLNHIDKLRLRIEDTSSKVLVTGDLNAGKSTFVNALLGRDVMPVDQQPCTTMFCEVHDSNENEDVEEAHIVNEGMTYSREDESTFTRATLAELESIVGESDAQHILKLYVKDARNPSQSLLNNGVVDISLIDAPGLNRDSLGTTEIFARQEEIDVVVFVVSAENHFTLSAKEFLFNASNEKAYIFVVVNKYDQIRDKAKCRRMVLDQIKQLSPRTWEDAEDLVHFVDSSAALARAAFPDAEPPKSSVPSETFEKMEGALRSFVLVKRAKSKLMPATTYLSNILADIELLVATNRIVATADRDQARENLDRVRPVVEKMKREKQGLEEGLDMEEDETAQQAYDRAHAALEAALDQVGKGELAVDADTLSAPSSRQQKTMPKLPTYPGLLRVWEYAANVRKVLLLSLDLAVALAEDDARSLATAGVNRVFAVAERHLPSDVEKTRRVFVPEAMFSPRARKAGRGQAIVAGGVHGLGIGLAQRQDLLEVSVLDMFVLHPHLSKLGVEPEEDEAHSAWTLMSLGLGAVTMVGGNAVGVRGVIEGVAQLGDIFGNESTRKWAIPVLGITTLGVATYLILELPKTIPKSIGRQIKASLTATDAHSLVASSLVTSASTPSTFMLSHAQRIQKETRKVMRLAAWDSRERFRVAYEEKSREVKAAEQIAHRAEHALTYFEAVDQKTDAVREQADLTAAPTY